MRCTRFRGRCCWAWSPPVSSNFKVSAMLRFDRFRNFLHGFDVLLDRSNDEATILDAGSVLLGELVSRDDWLPESCARPDPERYQQYLARDRFSVVSFVWGPGQSTPVHDHRTWGIIGMLRGSESSRRYRRAAGGDLLLDGDPVQ